jgi:hypothetical protein
MEEEFAYGVEEPRSEYNKPVVYNTKHRAYVFSKEVVLHIGTLKFDRNYFFNF